MYLVTPHQIHRYNDEHPHLAPSTVLRGTPPKMLMPPVQAPKPVQRIAHRQRQPTGYQRAGARFTFKYQGNGPEHDKLAPGPSYFTRKSAYAIANQVDPSFAKRPWAVGPFGAKFRLQWGRYHTGRQGNFLTTMQRSETESERVNRLYKSAFEPSNKSALFTKFSANPEVNPTQESNVLREEKTYWTRRQKEYAKLIAKMSVDRPA